MEKIKKISGNVIFLIVSMIAGFSIGIISARFFPDSMGENMMNRGLVGELFNMGIMFFIFLIGFFLHIIIHEAGHLVFGILTGYSFVSFRVGSFIIIKEEDKFKLKRYNLPGTGGQCLMMPPESKEGKFPFIIYNLGGAIMNLIFAITGILILIYIDGIGSAFHAILIIFVLVGIFTALTNAIPLKISGISNDGHNVMSMLRDEEAKRGFYLQLRVNGLQHQGIRIKDLPLESFKLKEGVDITSPLNTSVRLMEYSWYLDNMDLENAKKTIDSFIPYINKLIPIYQYEINCERMFLELIGDCDKEFIDSLYDKKLKKYVKQAKFMLSKKRLIMAYEGFYNEDKAKALKIYKELKELATKSPSKGDSESEIMIADLIMSRL